MHSLSILLILSILFIMMSVGCSTQGEKDAVERRLYSIERVGPARVVQLYADGFEQLTPRQRIFAYYLSLAGIAGRDIAIDQHHPNALEVRELLEQIYSYPQEVDSTVLDQITQYLKLFWINNGFYDNYTSTKFVPTCTYEEFSTAAKTAQKNGAVFALNGESLDQKLSRLRPVIFDPNFQPKMTDKSPGQDWLKASSVNYYDPGLTYGEVERWARAGNEKNPLNSKVVKLAGKISEKVWRAGDHGIEPGMYAEDLRAVIKYLELAIPYAESDDQAETIRLLVKYLKTGDPVDFRTYNIHWVKDSSTIDFILGFIEVYIDPRGQKGEWESVVFYTNPEQTKLMQNLALYAQYFEDKSPWKDEYKKRIDRSPIANVVNVIGETGGSGPVSPIGINLPNEQAIRQEHGSKSVLLQNVTEAHKKSSGRDIVLEFAYDAAEIEREDIFGTRADNLHTAMHEVIGHGSGKVSDKLQGKDPSEFLPGYYNTLEEARADLVALWHAWDPKLTDLGIASDASEARKIGETMYDQAMRVAIAQLRRIGMSEQLEEDHMKNRQLIAQYILRNTEAARMEQRDGKTYYRIVDYDKARDAVGILLAEVMRIKAEGDLSAAKELIDGYGLRVDPKLRDEVRERVARLDIASYNGYVQPRLEPVMDPEANIVDVKVDYPLNLARQMLSYSAFTKNERAAARLEVSEVRR